MTIDCFVIGVPKYGRYRAVHLCWDIIFERLLWITHEHYNVVFFVYLHICVTFVIQSLVFPYYTHECSCILKCQRKYVCLSHNMVLGSIPVMFRMIPALMCVYFGIQILRWGWLWKTFWIMRFFAKHDISHIAMFNYNINQYFATFNHKNDIHDKLHTMTSHDSFVFIVPKHRDPIV